MYTQVGGTITPEIPCLHCTDGTSQDAGDRGGVYIPLPLALVLSLSNYIFTGPEG